MMRRPEGLGQGGGHLAWLPWFSALVAGAILFPAWEPVGHPWTLLLSPFQPDLTPDPPSLGSDLWPEA